MTRIRTIRADLLDLLEYAETEEPQLYQRLQEIWKWIKDKKDGLIISKNHVLNLLEEVIQDSIFWLEYKTLTTGEQDQVNQTLSSSRYYWSLVLFHGFKKPIPNQRDGNRNYLEIISNI